MTYLCPSALPQPTATLSECGRRRRLSVSGLHNERGRYLHPVVCCVLDERILLILIDHQEPRQAHLYTDVARVPCSPREDHVGIAAGGDGVPDAVVLASVGTCNGVVVRRLHASAFRGGGVVDGKDSPAMLSEYLRRLLR